MGQEIVTTTTRDLWRLKASNGRSRQFLALPHWLHFQTTEVAACHNHPSLTKHSPHPPGSTCSYNFYEWNDSPFYQRNTKVLFFLLLIHRFSQSSHSGNHGDRELSFINCGRSLVDTSIKFWKLVLVQLRTCMQMILFSGDSTLPCKASSSEVQPTSYVSSNILAKQVTTKYRHGS